MDENDLKKVDVPRSGGALEDTIARVDRILSCYVGPTTMPKDQRVAAAILRLRGHAIATVIARYAALNVTGEVGDRFQLEFRRVDDMQEIARVIFNDLNEVEFLLRSEEDSVFKAQVAPSKYTFLPEVERTFELLERLDRILAVLDAVRDANKPTRTRARAAILNIIATARTPTSGGVQTALNDIKTGLFKLAVLEMFGTAYLDAAKSHLECAIKRENGIPRDANEKRCGATLADDWKAWDSLLDEACQRLAKAAKINDPKTCLTSVSYK